MDNEPEAEVPSTAQGQRLKGRLVHEEVLGYKVVEFSPHADNRMKARGISEAEVIATIRHPDATGLEARGGGEGRKRVRSYRGSKRAIDVIYEPFRDRLIIVSAMKCTLKKHEQPKQ